MQTHNQVSLSRKVLYWIMCVLVLGTTFGAGSLSYVYAQDGTPEPPPPTSEPTACYTLEFVVAEGEGTLEAVTPQNCDGGYLAGTTVKLVSSPSEGFTLLSWLGTINDASLETINYVMLNDNVQVSASFAVINSEDVIRTASTAQMIDVHIPSVIYDEVNSYYRNISIYGYLDGEFSVNMVQWLIANIITDLEVRYTVELWREGIVITPIETKTISHTIRYDYNNSRYRVYRQELGTYEYYSSSADALTAVRTLSHAEFASTYTNTNKVYIKIKATLVLPLSPDENTALAESPHVDLRTRPSITWGVFNGKTYYVGRNYSFQFMVCNNGSVMAPNGYFTITTSSPDLAISGSSTIINPGYDVWNKYGEQVTTSYPFYEWNFSNIGVSPACQYANGTLFPLKAGSYWIQSKMTLNSPTSSGASTTYVGAFNSHVSILDEQSWYSQRESITVLKNNSSTSITSDTPDPSYVKQSYPVSVTVSGSYGTPTGTVNVSDGSASCTLTLSWGSGSCNLSSTTSGSKTLTASYGGDNTYNSSSGTTTHTVEKSTPTITINDSPDPSIVNTSYTVSVSVSGSYGTPTGTVSITDGSGGSCTITLSGGSGSCGLTSTTTGGKTLTATYSGDSTYNSSSGTTSHTVNPGGGDPNCNTTPISIPLSGNTSGVSSPYPSNITLSGYEPSISDVNVRLLGLTHTYPDDIDILLVSPSGRNMILMSDSGSYAEVNDINLKFDDSASQTLPDTSSLASGTYRPTNNSTGDTFPSPAPAPSSATALSYYNGTNPNGTWSLYVYDDAGGDTGILSGGWCLDVTATTSLTSRLITRSTGTYDGYVLESTETSGRGGTVNATNTTFLLGDGISDRQYRGFLSFNTAALPDNAVITRVTLKIKKQGVVGTNPFTILGRLKADIRKPYFGTFPGLQVTDFQAAASKVFVGTFTINPLNNWYIGVIGSAGYPYINKTGTTQFRLRFYKDDNDDGGADYMRFYSGNYLYAASRPTLVIEYYVP